MLTHTQRKLLLFIERRLDETGGVSPSFREMARAMDFVSLSAVHHRLAQLELRGYVSRLRDRNRAITVIRPISRFAVFRFDDEKKELVGA